MILSYHNIVDTPLDAFDRRAGRVHKDKFRSQIQRIALFYKPVSLSDYLKNLRPDLEVAITFDDAHYGVLEQAGPILSDLGFPATVFVVTSYANPQPKLLHFDEIEIAFRLTKQPVLHIPALHEQEFDLYSVVGKVACMTQIKRKMKNIPDHKRKQCQRILLDLLRVYPQECRDYAKKHIKYRVLCWQELRTMVKQGWGIGSHTVTHPALAQIELNDLKKEIQGSMRDIRRELQLSDIPFAYPYGKKDHIGSISPKVVRDAGYTCGLTTIPGINDRQTDLYFLPRVSTSVG